MSAVEFEQIRTPFSEDQPCGPSLESDPAKFGLREAMKGTPTRYMGDEVIPGEEPNWRDVARQGSELLARSKDLEVVMIMSLAALQLDGIDGMVRGLAAMNDLMDEFWPSVYPLLDEDEGDAIERLSILSPLTVDRGTFGDDWRLVERLRLVPLTDSRQAGRFSLRQIELATGVAEPAEDEDIPSLDLIEAAFDDTEIEVLMDLARRASEGAEVLDALSATINGHAESGGSPDFAPVRRTLRRIHEEVSRRLERRGYASSGAIPEDDDGDTAEASMRSAPAAGEINSPRDVTMMLDRMIQYYAREEPSSPVPLLLKRAQDLVGKSFMDIMRDLSPDSMDQIRIISGVRDESE
ncbi:MAG: type VI secretion system protein TssA [Phycisphaerales bacterium]|nr:type VI secretion system protein TssA [Phycisphaerales bacterium]